jgi:predicted nucleic-acid-binding protein
VLCELAWVLETAYDYSREEIARAFEQILATAELEVERLDQARQALGDFRSTKADFSDALIGRINRSLGAEHTATFDRDLKALETFRLL